MANHVAKCVALASTINVPRNARAAALGCPIEVPVGKEMFGRVVNVAGEPIDRKGEIQAALKLPIRQRAAALYLNPDEMHRGGYELRETGIKINDLLYPRVKGSQPGTRRGLP